MQIRREQRISRVQRNDFDRTGGRIGIPNAQSSRTTTPPLSTRLTVHTFQCIMRVYNYKQTQPTHQLPVQNPHPPSIMHGST